MLWIYERQSLLEAGHKSSRQQPTMSDTDSNQGVNELEKELGIIVSELQLAEENLQYDEHSMPARALNHSRFFTKMNNTKEGRASIGEMFGALARDGTIIVVEQKIYSGFTGIKHYNVQSTRALYKGMTIAYFMPFGHMEQQLDVIKKVRPGTGSKLILKNINTGDFLSEDMLMSFHFSTSLDLSNNVDSCNLALLDDTRIIVLNAIYTNSIGYRLDAANTHLLRCYLGNWVKC